MTHEEYLREVAAQLRDLQWKQRRDLVAELRGHLAELPPGESELEAPTLYAANLREAAGLERQRGAIAFLRARRPRNVAAVVLLMTLIGLAIPAVVWIDSYQPLTLGNRAIYPIGAHSLPGIEGEGIEFHSGQPFQFGIEIMNNRRFTVRVLGVQYVPRAITPWHAQLRMGPPSYTGAEMEPSRRFQPFDLQPGQRRFLFFRGVLWCSTGWVKGNIAGFSDFPVRYSFLWRKASTEIPLPQNLTIDFSKESCPSGGRPWPKR